jgi:hypothetical protein
MECRLLGLKGGIAWEHVLTRLLSSWFYEHHTGACLIGLLKLSRIEVMTGWFHPVPWVMSNFARVLSFSGTFHEVVLNLQTKAKGKQWSTWLGVCFTKVLEAFGLQQWSYLSSIMMSLPKVPTMLLRRGNKGSATKKK